MNILGVHIGHDSSAAIVVDGGIVADVAEERFSRIKHDAGLPVRAIGCALEIAGFQMKDIDAVAVPTDRDFWPLNELFDLHGGPHEQSRRLNRTTEVARRLSGGAIPPPARRPLYGARYPLAKHTELVKVPHHLAHAACAYFTSGYADRQLIVTLDGIGDGVSGGVWRGEAGAIEPLVQFRSAGSLGWFYGNVTEALGWAHGDGEGTTMALAAYERAKPAQGALAPFHPRFEDGALVASHDYPPVHGWMERGSLQWHCEEAARIRELVPRFGGQALAAEAQRVLEEQVAQIVHPWLEREHAAALSCAGGVFLNVKLNHRLRESEQLDRHHVYPNPGDAGLAVGAALHAYHLTHRAAELRPIEHLYRGPQHSQDEIGELLRARGLRARRCDDVAGYAASRLARNEIVGWFQGRMESGPRALGNRSILANPCRQGNKDILNERVKLREPFRPYGPSLLAECAGEYLRDARSEPFMISSFAVQAGKRDSIPAVVHVDGTLRPQTVEHRLNPRYYELIKAFGQLTGERLVLNTSFNARGDPIACHPRDAIRTFYDTAMDCLILGDFVLTKRT